MQHSANKVLKLVQLPEEKETPGSTRSRPVL